MPTPTEFVYDDGDLPPTAKREAPYLTLNRHIARNGKLLGALRESLTATPNDAAAALISQLEGQLDPLRSLQTELKNASQATSGLWRAERELDRLRTLLRDANISTQRAPPPPPPPVHDVEQSGPGVFADALAQVRVLQAKVEAQDRELRARADQINKLTKHNQAHAALTTNRHEGAAAQGKDSVPACSP